MEEIRLRCVRTKEWKLIYTTTSARNVSSGGLDNGKYELYNLSNDPKEERNIFENRPEVAKELKKNSFSGSKQLRQKNIVLNLMQELIRFNRDEKKRGKIIRLNCEVVFKYNIHGLFKVTHFNYSYVLRNTDAA